MPRIEYNRRIFYNLSFLIQLHYRKIPVVAFVIYLLVSFSGNCNCGGKNPQIQELNKPHKIAPFCKLLHKYMKINII